MANYLALIRKADFIDLYKYGSIHINRDLPREFSCKIEELADKKCVFDDLTRFANSFDSTFTYVIIHYVHFEHSFKRMNDINIADVQGIYPLDFEAKKELSLSFDQRIIIHDPIWPDAVFNLQKKQTIQDCKNGASNIWNIYNISDSINEIRNVIGDTIIEEVVEELYDNRRPKGELPIWVYIMRYERHAFYPNTTIGAFMDTVNAIFNYHQKQEVDSSAIESTMIMRFLCNCNEKNPNMPFDEVLKRLYEEPQMGNFINLTTDIEPRYNLIRIATLFYIYRNRYKENFKYEQKLEQHGKSYGFEFSIVCYMLGCVLGHEHTYDCLYEHLPLAIYKCSSTTRQINEKIYDKKNDTYVNTDNAKKEVIDESIPQKQVSQTSLFVNDEVDKLTTELKFPLTLQKYTRSGKRSTAKESSKVFNNAQEYQNFIDSTKDDWRIIN